MQNNVKLIAVRYLPGSVLLGGTGEKGILGGVGVRNFTSNSVRKEELWWCPSWPA